MKLWAGVTDNDWYSFLSARGLDEVNFWRPSPGPYFTSLPAGTPFLFKLKAPCNHAPNGGPVLASSRTCLPKARILHPDVGNGLRRLRGEERCRLVQGVRPEGQDVAQVAEWTLGFDFAQGS
jgi:hypothetical protein